MGATRGGPQARGSEGGRSAPEVRPWFTSAPIVAPVHREAMVSRASRAGGDRHGFGRSNASASASVPDSITRQAGPPAEGRDSLVSASFTLVV